MFDDENPVVGIVSCAVGCHLERKTREKGRMRHEEGEREKGRRGRGQGEAEEGGSGSSELPPASMVNDLGLLGGEGGR